MAEEDVAIVMEGEELPTDEKVRYLTVEVLSKEERERIAVLLSDIAEKVESIKRPYDLDIVIEDVKQKLSDAVQELHIVSSSLSAKLDSSLQRFDARTESLAAIAYMKNDLQAVVSDIESCSKDMETRMAGTTHGLERVTEEFSRILASLEILKEEAAMSIGDAASKFQSQLEPLSSVASEFGDTKTKFSALENSIKEANVKLSILIDSVEQKVFELSTIFDNVGNIGKNIESQTASLKNVVDFMREFIEHAEDSSIKLDNALSDFSAFRDRLDTEMKRIAETVDERTGMLEVAARELSGIRSQLDAKFEELDAIRSDLSEAVYAISKNTPLMEKAAADMLDIHSLVSTSADRMDRSAENLEKMAQQSGDFIAAQKSVSVELKSATDVAENAVKSMKSVSENLEDTVKAVDRKTDDILNVLFRKVNELKNVDTALEKTSAVMTSASNELEKVVDRLSSLPQVKSIRKKKAKKRPAKPLKKLEDEALDLLILNSLKKIRMTVPSLAEATDVSEARLRKRLKVLIGQDKVRKERQGRYVFYSSKVEVV